MPNQRIRKEARQRVIATLGRLDTLQGTGQLDQLLGSLVRGSDRVAVLGARKANRVTSDRTVHLRLPLAFGKLWKEPGLPETLRRLFDGRRFEFPAERVVFFAALHRRFVSGGGRAAERWRRKDALGDVGTLDLQHFHRAMGWLGEPLSADQHPAAQPLAPRLRQDMIEEAFDRLRDTVPTSRTQVDIEGVAMPKVPVSICRR